MPAVAPDASRLLAAACGIADEIAARAVREGGRTNWLGLERVSGPHWAVLPMGAGLAQGYCGVALFLAHTAALAGADRYAALAREAVRPLPVLLKALADEPELSAAAGPGAYDGLGGIVYAVLPVSRHCYGPDVADCLPDALTALGHAASVSSEPGFATGTAGALGRRGRGARDDRRPGGAESGGRSRRTGCSARWPERSPAPRAPCSPVRSPLCRPPRTAFPPVSPTAPRRVSGWGPAAVRRPPPRGTPPRTPPPPGRCWTPRCATPGPRPRTVSWSGGLAGAAAVAAHLSPAPSVSRVPVRPADAEVRPDLSLGRGTLGTLEALAVRAGRGDPAAAGALARRTGRALALVEAQGHRCATPDHVPSPGPLDGLSGIGYGLLRLAHPGTVPPPAYPDH
ncbi:hypothetical protein SHIRM173S_06190 [Streptomyces hirsutus]